MNVKWVALVVFIWITGTILGLIMEGEQLGASHQSTLNDLLIWQKVSSIEGGWSSLQIITFVPSFFGALFTLLSFNFSFLSGDLQIVRWVVLAPIAAVVTWGLILTLFGIFSRVVGGG